MHTAHKLYCSHGRMSERCPWSAICAGSASLRRKLLHGPDVSSSRCPVASESGSEMPTTHAHATDGAHCTGFWRRSLVCWACPARCQAAWLQLSQGLPAQPLPAQTLQRPLSNSASSYATCPAAAPAAFSRVTLGFEAVALPTGACQLPVTLPGCSCVQKSITQPSHSLVFDDIT